MTTSTTGVPVDLTGCHMPGGEWDSVMTREIAVKDLPEQILGKGSYGVVYAGVLPPNDTKIAIKEVVISLVHFTEEEFLSEVKFHLFLYNNGGNLMKTSIPQLYAAYVCKANTSTTGLLFVELWDGDCWKLVKRGLPSSPIYHIDFETAVIYNFFRAINAMHILQVYHTDLHPGNVLFKKNETDPSKIARLGISDFGLCVLIDSSSRQVLDEVFNAPKVYQWVSRRQLLQNQFFFDVLDRVGADLLTAWGLDPAVFPPGVTSIHKYVLMVAPEFDDFFTIIAMSLMKNKDPVFYIRNLLNTEGISPMLAKHMPVAEIVSFQSNRYSRSITVTSLPQPQFGTISAAPTPQVTTKKRKI